MNKIQTMMLMLLVAAMGMAVQSCGSDDNKTVTTPYTFAATVDVKNQGSLSDDDVNTFKDGFSRSETGYYASDAEAKAAADKAINTYKSQIESYNNIDWSTEEANIVITINTTNNITNVVVSQWTITIHKGVTVTQVK